jgi:RimJ/RimL family protein N-acetyltransferase
MSHGGRDVLRMLKDLAGAPGPALLLRVGDPPVAFLRPVAGRSDRLDPADVERLTAWRNRHVHSFLTEFEATTERTAAWLVANHPDDSRILFMVDDPAGTTFGYMGLASIDWEDGVGEADSIVRGAESAPGTMSAALRALIAWGTGPLGLRRIYIRVRSDNPVMPFYDRLGFVERSRVPLRLEPSETETRRWVEDPAADSGLFVIHLEAGGTTG